MRQRSLPPLAGYTQAAAHQPASRPAGRQARTLQHQPAAAGAPPRARPRRCARPAAPPPARAPAGGCARARTRARAPSAQRGPPRPRGRARRGAHSLLPRGTSLRPRSHAPRRPADLRSRPKEYPPTAPGTEPNGEHVSQGAPHTRRGGADPNTRPRRTDSSCCDSPHDQSVGAMDGGCTSYAQHTARSRRRSTAGGLLALPFLRAAGIWRLCGKIFGIPAGVEGALLAGKRGGARRGTRPAGRGRARRAARPASWGAPHYDVTWGTAPGGGGGRGQRGCARARVPLRLGAGRERYN